MNTDGSRETSSWRHQIEVDEEVYKFLKDHAEPFKDTPNRVLRRYLLQGSEKIVIQDEDVVKAMITFPDTIPSQFLGNIPIPVGSIIVSFEIK